jgi:hypothetical protein
MVQISSDIVVVVETADGRNLIGPATIFCVWAASLNQSAVGTSVQIDVDVDLPGG